jgi:hypothetical protein
VNGIAALFVGPAFVVCGLVVALGVIDLGRRQPTSLTPVTTPRSTITLMRHCLESRNSSYGLPSSLTMRT